MTQNIELMQECSSLKERLEAMSANNIAIEGAIVVKSTPLFHALVKESCELESNRLNRVITPVMLLISMFNNYVVKGDFFLFRAPKRKRIIELSKEYPDGEE